MLNKDKSIIVRKNIILQKDSHHGGAWKVAYADFVTAMMAFFLLLWLLNSTPSQKLKGIAQYFEPTIGLMNRKSLDKDSSESRSEDEAPSDGPSVSGLVYGVKRAGQIVSIQQQGMEQTDIETENKTFMSTQENIERQIQSDAALSKFKNQITLEQTPDGLLIQVQDSDKQEMFESGSATLSPNAKLILEKIVKLIQYSPNFISIGGYTDRINNNTGNYTAWELSADRANAARRFIVNRGIASDRIAKVVAYADSAPLDENNPYAAKNRRVSIMLMRNSVMPFYKVSAPKDLKPSK
ncbi:MAG: OmpA family protein [Candidatus Midichloria sp.]|nr:OmpA family protein [Candidatus Midichloria sp.]